MRRPNVHRLGAAKNRRAPARAGKSNGVGSAAVPGRINPMTDRAPVSITQTRRPIFDRLGAGKNARAPARAGKGNDGRERGRPRPHQRDNQPYDLFRSCKSCARMFTGWVRARMPALLHALEKPPTVGSAAVLGRINVTTDPTTRFDHANAAPEHSPAENAQTTSPSPDVILPERLACQRSAGFYTDRVVRTRHAQRDSHNHPYIQRA